MVVIKRWVYRGKWKWVVIEVRGNLGERNVFSGKNLGFGFRKIRD